MVGLMLKIILIIELNYRNFSIFLSLGVSIISYLFLRVNYHWSRISPYVDFSILKILQILFLEILSIASLVSSYYCLFAYSLLLGLIVMFIGFTIFGFINLCLFGFRTEVYAWWNKPWEAFQEFFTNYCPTSKMYFSINGGNSVFVVIHPLVVIIVSICMFFKGFDSKLFDNEFMIYIVIGITPLYLLLCNMMLIYYLKNPYDFYYIKGTPDDGELTSRFEEVNHQENKLQDLT